MHLSPEMVDTVADFLAIDIRNDRLANRVGLHLALGGGFAQAPTP
jgi:hypothetical protein